jgi:hypothetical protein
MFKATGHAAIGAPLSVVGKARLAVRIWLTYLEVRWTIWRHDLPRAVDRLGVPGEREPRPVGLLGRAVSRALRIGPWQPRCLTRSLVLFRLLRAQGSPGELVIGLPEAARSVDAHAWVEIDGRDVGPAPGRFGHQELVRYPRPIHQ